MFRLKSLNKKGVYSFHKLLCTGVVALVILAGCSGESPDKKKNKEGSVQSFTLPEEPEFHSVLPAEASEMLNTIQTLMVVDVRTEGEFEQLKIPGSVSVSFSSIMTGESGLPKDRPILLVGAVGGRSYAAGLKLTSEDYPLIYNLRGGILAWERAGLAVEYGK